MTGIFTPRQVTSSGSAFHIVNNGTLPVAFYTKDYSPRFRKIILTDEIFKLRDTAFFDNFTGETEARWRLVETAWAQRIAANLLEIKYTEMGDLLYITTKKYRRKTVTSVLTHIQSKKR